MKVLATTCTLGMLLAITGCVTSNDAALIPGVPDVTVPPHVAQAAVDDFRLPEYAAAAYLRLPVCGVAQPCRTAAYSRTVAQALRAGRKARDYVRSELAASHGGPISVTSWSALTKEIGLLQSIVSTH